MRVSICISTGLPFGGGWCENPIIKLAGNPTHANTAQAATETVAGGLV